MPMRNALPAADAGQPSLTIERRVPSGRRRTSRIDFDRGGALVLTGAPLPAADVPAGHIIAVRLYVGEREICMLRLATCAWEEIHTYGISRFCHTAVIDRHFAGALANAHAHRALT